MDTPTPDAATDPTPVHPTQEATSSPEITVHDNDVQDRFELFVDGTPAGMLNYRLQGNDYALIHTEIDPDFQGRGMGSQLISRSLDQLRESGKGIIPECPFVLSYVRRHEEYLDLVPTRHRADFDLPAR